MLTVVPGPFVSRRVRDASACRRTFAGWLRMCGAARRRGSSRWTSVADRRIGGPGPHGVRRPARLRCAGSFSVHVGEMRRLQVQGCVIAAACHRDIQGFAGDLVVDKNVRGVDGATLGASGGGRVGELDVVGDEVRGQPNAPGTTVADVGLKGPGDGEVPIAVASDNGPGAAVLDEAAYSYLGETPIVSTGDDAVSDAGAGAVCEAHTNFLDDVGGDAPEPCPGVQGGGPGRTPAPRNGPRVTRWSRGAPAGSGGPVQVDELHGTGGLAKSSRVVAVSRSAS